MKHPNFSLRNVPFAMLLISSKHRLGHLWASICTLDWDAEVEVACKNSEGVTGKLCSDIRKSSSRWKDQDGQREAPVFRLSTSGCE